MALTSLAIHHFHWRTATGVFGSLAAVMCLHTAGYVVSGACIEGAVAAALSLLLIAVLLRIFAKPLGLTLKLLLNTLAGFFALFLLRALQPLTGITLGCNLFNASVLGVLGFPGFVLLLLLKWVLMV